MLNKVTLIGRLGKDPELRYASNGTPMLTLRVATDESYNDREGNKVERTEWHSVVVFQRQAETCANYLGKGSLIYVEGSLQTRKWQDQQGQERYSTEVRANRVLFLDRRGGAEGGGQGGGYGEGGGRPRPAGQKPKQQNQNYDEDLGPAFPSEASGMDDVPF